MKNLNCSRASGLVRASVIAACTVIVNASACGAAVTVSISPNTQTAIVGNQVHVDVVVSGLGGGTAVGTYDITVAFNPTVVSYSGAAFGSQLNLSGLGDVQTVTLASGTVELFEVSLDAPGILNADQAASFKLATLTFNAIGAGMDRPISLILNALGDASGNPISAKFQNGSITVSLSSLLPPSISSGGVVPVYSTATTIEAGSWISIYGSNLASGTTVWSGNFPTMLGGTTVTIDSRSAYLWFVSPNQINAQAPIDTSTGTVVVSVTTPAGTASSTVTLGEYGPSLSLLNNKYPAAIVLTPGVSGNSGAGYDLIGPTGVFSFSTRPVKAGETLILYGVGFGPTSPTVLAGQPYSGTASCLTLPLVTIGGVTATVSFAGIVEAGLYQLNVVVPNSGSGDQLLQASIGGVMTPDNIFVTLQ